MTRLSIVKSLLSNQRDIRRQTIRVTLNFLTRDQTKQEMSERLGYDVEQLSTWVITTDGAHITIRGFRGSCRAAITVHIYVDEWYRYEDYAAWLNGKKLRQKTTQLR
ncbi:hypothetical protein EYR36_011906 [Pleurotus pulmonarius]|nr:hypothetical protein EYR36_011906 [Pleurotus pulmonarius]